MGNTITGTFTLPSSWTAGTTLGQKTVAFTPAAPTDLVSLLSRGTKTASAPAPSGPPAAEPSTLARANRRGFETFADWNDKVGGVVGGALGLGVVIPALYVGVIGGAIAGGIAGLGFGPAAAVLQGAHGLSFLGTILSTGGTAAKIATVIGTATGTVGGFVVGQKVGRTLGAVPLFAAAYPVGFAKGLVSKDDPYQDPADPQQPAKPQAPAKHERPGAIQKTAQGLLGGAGLITGSIGGAVIGAGVMSGAAITSGLIASNLTWSALGAGALAGAIGGGILFAGLCGFGGYAIATGVSRAVNWAKEKAFPDKEQVALEQKRDEVAKKQAQFDQIGAAVAQKTADTQTYMKDTEAKLESARKDANTYIDGKEADVTTHTQAADAYVQAAQQKLDARQGQITKADGQAEAAINGRADGIFGDIRKPTDDKYAGLGHTLDQQQAGLQGRDDQISANERAQAQTIEQKTGAAYDEKMKPVTAKYDQLNAQQTQRSTGLDTWDGQIKAGNAAVDTQVTADGQKDFQGREPGLEATYRQKETDLRHDYQGRTDRADQKAQGDLAALAQQHQSDMQQLDSRYNQMSATAAAEANNLQSQQGQLQFQVGQLQNEYNTAQGEERSAQSDLSSAQQQRENVIGEARRERDQAVSDRDQTRNEVDSAQRGVDQANRDRDNYINQKAQVDGQIPGLRAERDRLQAQVNGQH